MKQGTSSMQTELLLIKFTIRRDYIHRLLNSNSRLKAANKACFLHYYRNKENVSILTREQGPFVKRNS